MDQVVGGVKKKAKSTKTKNNFKIDAMMDALNDMMGTTIKKSRKKMVQPLRPPSARVKSMPVSRNTTVASVAKAVKMKPPVAPKTKRVRRSKMVPETITLSRQHHTTIEFKPADIQLFVNLFNKFILDYEYVDAIKQAAKAQYEEIDETEVNNRVLEVIDTLYFKIRDSIKRSLGIVQKDMSDIMEE